MSDDIEVVDWQRLDRLPQVLERVGTQIDDVFDYARRWVARPDGFATSDACVLRPLAEGVEALDRVFAAARRRHDDDWRDLCDDVRAAAARLRDSDVAAVLRLPEPPSGPPLYDDAA